MVRETSVQPAHLHPPTRAPPDPCRTDDDSGPACTPGRSWERVQDVSGSVLSIRGSCFHPEATPSPIDPVLEAVRYEVDSTAPGHRPRDVARSLLNPTPMPCPPGPSRALSIERRGWSDASAARAHNYWTDVQSKPGDWRVGGANGWEIATVIQQRTVTAAAERPPSWRHSGGPERWLTRPRKCAPLSG